MQCDRHSVHPSGLPFTNAFYVLLPIWMFVVHQSDFCRHSVWLISLRLQLAWLVICSAQLFWRGLRLPALEHWSYLLGNSSWHASENTGYIFSACCFQTWVKKPIPDIVGLSLFLMNWPIKIINLTLFQWVSCCSPLTCFPSNRFHIYLSLNLFGFIPFNFISKSPSHQKKKREKNLSMKILIKSESHYDLKETH